jgi:hypothetical protein
MTLYDVMVFVFSYILLVTPSGAGPPLDTLYLMPKSAFGPPGLWLAVKRIPPSALYFLMMFDAAGVDKMESFPTINFATPFADPILRIVWTVSGEKKRPSPPITSVDPSALIESRMAWMKFSV